MNAVDVVKVVSEAANVVKVGLSLLGESGAKSILESVVDFIGESAAKNHIDQYAAARLAADAAETAKFGDEP